MVFVLMFVAVAVLLLVLYPTIRASNERERLRKEEALKPVSSVPFQSAPTNGFGNASPFVQPASINPPKLLTLAWEAKYPAGPNHPLGVHTEERMRLLSWLRCASAVLHNGGHWESCPREDAIRDLEGYWGIKNALHFRNFHAGVMALYTDGFGYVRFIGVLLLGICAGYASPEEVWPSLQVFTRRIKRDHNSFESLWWAYLRGYQQFAGDSSPLAETRHPEVRQRIQQGNAWRGREVPFEQTFVDEAPALSSAEWMSVLMELHARPEAAFAKQAHPAELHILHCLLVDQENGQLSHR